jgi:ATP-dependent helicase/DNAse subunit B
MDEETFCDFLDYSVFAARQACKEIKDGFVKATPYAKNCEFCKYGGMCGFQKDVSSARNETNIETTAIAEIAKKQREGKGE